MLSRIRRAMADKDKGFTLIELLVVIIIIGILAAIAIPVFLDQRKKSVDASLKSDLHNAAVFMEAWAVDNPAEDIPYIYTIANSPGPTTGWLTGLKVSDGNKLLVIKSSTARGWCIRASNPNASKATKDMRTFTWRSLQGGLDTTAASILDVDVCP